MVPLTVLGKYRKKKSPEFSEMVLIKDEKTKTQRYIYLQLPGKHGKKNPQKT